MGYSFGWSDRVTVECPKLDEFMREFVSLCERYGVGYSEGGGYLVLRAFKDADFAMFTDRVEEYQGGVPWLDEAKKLYESRLAEFRAEDNRVETIKREKSEREQYERLKAKYG